MAMRIVTLLWLCTFLVPWPCSGATLRVPSEYATIQSAIDAAHSGDTVLVAPGTYTDCDGGKCLEAVATLRTGITLMSEAGPDVTVLTADGPLSAKVVDAQNIGAAGAIIRGFTLTSQTSPRIGLNGRFSLRLEIHDCVFLGNTAAIGVNTGIASDEVVITGCTFDVCTGIPAAIQTYDIDARVENCVFRNCSGGLTTLFSGEETRTVVVRDCLFESNDTGTLGSVLQLSEVNDATVERCVFRNIGKALTASVYPLTAHGVVRDCVFAGGTSSTRSAAAEVSGSGTMELVGNTAVGNTGVQSPAAIYLHSRIVVFRNNIVAYTSGQTALRVALTETLENSCNVFWENAAGHYAGFVPDSTDRIVDPAFCDREAGDYSLSAGSSCLPPGSLGCGLIGALGQGCGSVAVERASWAQQKARYRKEDGTKETP